MAIALVQAPYGTSGGAQSGNGTSVVGSITVSSSGHLLVLTTCWVGATATASLSDSVGGSTWQSTPVASNGTNYVQVWYLPSAATGTHNVTVTFSASTASNAVTIAEFSGADPSSPLDTSTTASGTSASPATGSLAPTASGDLFVGAFVEPGFSSADFTPDPATGWSQLGSVQNGATYEGFGNGYLLGSGAASQSASWSLASSTSEPWAATIVSFKAPVSAVAFSPTRPPVTRPGQAPVPSRLRRANAMAPRAQILPAVVAGDGAPTAWTWSGTTGGVITPAVAFFPPPKARPGLGPSPLVPRAARAQILGAVIAADGAPTAWTWAGSTSTTTQLAAAVAGAWTWAGSTSTTTQLLSADGAPTAWVWAGATATLSGGPTQISGVSGAWTWAGTTSTTAQLVSATIGGWQWSGATAATSQLIAADGAPAGVSWSGTLAATTQLIAADGAPAGVTWSGTTSALGGAITTISATAGAWSWVGSTSTTSQLIGSSPASWTWSGPTATTTQVLSADGAPAGITWAGSTASTVQLITANGAPAGVVWSGITASIPGVSPSGSNIEWLMEYRRKGRR